MASRVAVQKAADSWWWGRRTLTFVWVTGNKHTHTHARNTHVHTINPNSTQAVKLWLMVTMWFRVTKGHLIITHKNTFLPQRTENAGAFFDAED